MTTTTDPARARDAYIWGYPLVVMHRTRALHCSRTPLGQLNHVERLATPTDRTVVAPNNDTLYSSGWYDLAAGDLVIEVPPIERYWSVMVLDAYTNVQYVSRRTHGRSGADVRLTLDPFATPPSTAADVLPVATPTVWILVRTLVDGPDDLPEAQRLQRQIRVVTPSDHPTHTTTRLGRPNHVHTAGAGYFTELADALATDPPAPWQPPPPEPVDVLRELANEVDEVELARGVELGEAELRNNPRLADTHANGWGTHRDGSAFGNDVLRRAAVAKYALAAHRPVENRSYVAQTDANGGRLDGTTALELRFGPGEPPCDGFWSLTVYGSDMFLVENAIDRYAIGDRTPGLRRDDDGALTLTVGGPRPSDPSNWLPAPDGRYILVLRVYEGHREVVDATWFPPSLSPDGARA